MKVVNYSEAARIAGVSRQMIAKLKNNHIKGKSKKTYFVHDPYTAKPGVDIDDKNWIKYVDKESKLRSNKNKASSNTKLQPTDNQNENFVHKNHFAAAVVNVIKSEIGFTGSQLKQLLEKIQREYERIQKV